MKNFHQNLLIALAVGLCLLCACQWYNQTVQRSEIQNLNQLVYQKSVAIRDCTNSIAALNYQITQMDARITELRESARTNEELAVAQKWELNKLQTANETLTNRIAEYKTGVDTLQAKLKEAYDGINKQNESLKELVAQRDEFVKKFNDSVKERNDIVAKYNELAARVEKLQSGGEVK
jgi:chromosome segregation ATPase